MDREYIKAKLANLPNLPGSYQMKDKDGEIIYVGKAKNLHNRVNQYFVGAHDFKTTKMVSNIDDFDFVVTASEKEALVLEINLIKKHRPKYNIQFIDDSTYPYIKLTREEYPRLVIARDTRKDKKARYFGPFPDATAARTTLKLLQSMYPFRRCAKLGTKVCLYYHMKQCLGPCCCEVDPEVYRTMADQVTKFLNGDTKEIEKELKQKMLDASERLEFEEANEYKQTLEGISNVIDKQNIEMDSRGSRDVFAWYADRGYMAITGFLVRSGTVLNKEFRLRPLYGDAEEEFDSFLIQYYEEHPAARELVLPNEMNIDTIKEVLDMPVFQPQKGYRQRLIDMCVENAKKQLDLKFEVVEHQDQVTEQAVKQLSELCGRTMHRVELFDNSHISGTFTVAACVVYEDGMPDKKDYRLYKLHTGNSDVDSMKEVLYRRYFRLLKENGHLPDGILVDGGRPQIDAAAEIIHSLNLDLVIMGLVKDDRHSTSALMDEAGNIKEIDRSSGLFFLLTRMQDEVHRVAISYHRKLRDKAQTKSILDEIEGVGPKRKRILLKTFGSFTALKHASEIEIAKVIPQEPAHKVYEALHEEEGGCYNGPDENQGTGETA
ncbi:MAG: excinuclease ABC subunit UvrC [Solobacterium sp.]|jgi:excinuclease ABC subunit C|nr:excinuclease ABC subunit UvrC [Solobacterium sp.]MCH4222437.1 excinuclease ABC subunit UvrC [Solobacterium sp.]MCH4265289.1 excinuclease ABC subunit UvrC [Solobacterium sp.]